MTGLTLITLAGHAWAQRRWRRSATRPPRAARRSRRVCTWRSIGHVFLLLIAANREWSLPPWPIFGALAVMTLGTSAASLVTRTPSLHAAGVVGAALVVASWAGAAGSPAVGSDDRARVGGGERVCARMDARRAARLAPSPRPRALFVGELAVLSGIGWRRAPAPFLAELLIHVARHRGDSRPDRAASVALRCDRGGGARVDGRRAVAVGLPDRVAVAAGARGSAVRAVRRIPGGPRHARARRPRPVPRRRARERDVLLRRSSRIRSGGARLGGRRRAGCRRGGAGLAAAVPASRSSRRASATWAGSRSWRAPPSRSSRLPFRCSSTTSGSPSAGRSKARRWRGCTAGFRTAACSTRPTALLAAVFVRLALNPEILIYEPRGDLRILNWYLYTYLVCAAAMFRRGLVDVRHQSTGSSRPAARFGAAAGRRSDPAVPAAEHRDRRLLLDRPDDRVPLRRRRSRRISTYTIGWLAFGMLLLAAGIYAKSRPARITAVALIAVTTLKCFLYDLARSGASIVSARSWGWRCRSCSCRWRSRSTCSRSQRTP